MFHHLFIGKLSSGGTFQSGVKTNFSWRNAVYLFLKTHRHDFFFFFFTSNRFGFAFPFLPFLLWPEEFERQCAGNGPH